MSRPLYESPATIEHWLHLGAETAKAAQPFGMPGCATRFTIYVASIQMLDSRYKAIKSDSGAPDKVSMVWRHEDEVGEAKQQLRINGARVTWPEVQDAYLDRLARMAEGEPVDWSCHVKKGAYLHGVDGFATLHLSAQVHHEGPTPARMTSLRLTRTMGGVPLSQSLIVRSDSKRARANNVSSGCLPPPEEQQPDWCHSMDTANPVIPLNALTSYQWEVLVHEPLSMGLRAELAQS